MKALLAVFLPLLIAYGVTLEWVVDRWNAPTGYYEHGWLLPFVGAGVIWLRRDRWRKAVAFVDYRALWLLVPGLLVHLAGALLMIDSLSALSLVLTVPGAAWLALGSERLRGLWPVLFLVLFAVPPPMVVDDRLAVALKEFAVEGGSALANVFGAGVTRAGSDLYVEGRAEPLFVAEACGGLRSLLAMVALGYCVAFFVGGRSLLRRGGLLLASVPLAVGANVVRIAALCIMAQWFGVDFASGTGHTLANAGELIFDIGALLLLDVLLSRLGGRGPEPAPVAAGAPPTAALARGLRGPAVALWLCCVPLLALSLYRPASGGGDRAARLPTEVAGYEHVPRSAEAERVFRQRLPRYVELLGTDDFVWREYRDAGGARVHVVALYHDSNWKSVHEPRICIIGSQMDIEIEDEIPAPWLDGGATLGRIVARSRIDNWQYLTLSVFGTVDWAAGNYSEFAWYHMPRALMRRSQSGFLFRVETPVTPGEDLDVAAARCERFLQGVLPAARELLR